MLVNTWNLRYEQELSMGVRWACGGSEEGRKHSVERENVFPQILEVRADVIIASGTLDGFGAARGPQSIARSLFHE